jgi:hypothetical protein
MSVNSRFFAVDQSQTIHRLVDSADLPRALSAIADVRLVMGDIRDVDQYLVDQADAAIQYFEQFDERVRDTICREATREDSVPGEILAQINLLGTGRALTPQEFSTRLQVRAVVVTPNGDDDASDRLNVTYSLTHGGVSRDLSAIVRIGSGLVFVAAPRASAPAGGITWA